MAHLTHTIENDLAIIVLDNPPENRLSAQMFSELSSALSVISSSEARALLLRAEG
jgi:enoyl-CoA hydratase/carnithine racemase